METGLSLTLSKTPKKGFLATRPNYFVCVNSEGSSETVLMPWLILALADHICDEYQTHVLVRFSLKGLYLTN